MKQAKRTIVILGLALAGCRGPVFAPSATPQLVDLHVLATPATYSLLQDFAGAYNRPGAQVVLDSGAASWPTLAAALRRRQVPYALTGYLPPDSGLWAAAVARDGIAVIVHPSNPIASLTLDDLRLLFGGRADEWSALGGLPRPVTVVSPQAGDDTRLAFEALVMDDRRTTLAARLAFSPSRMLALVASDPGAVGYVSMAALDPSVRAVPLVGAGGEPVLPSRETVASGAYPLITAIVVVGAQPPPDDSVYRDWFAWMQGPDGQAIVRRRYAPLPAGE